MMSTVVVDVGFPKICWKRLTISQSWSVCRPFGANSDGLLLVSPKTKWQIPEESWKSWNRHGWALASYMGTMWGPFQEWTRIFDLNLLCIHTQAPVILRSLKGKGWVNRCVAGFSVLARGLSTKEGSLNDTSSVWITGSPQFATITFSKISCICKLTCSTHTLGILNAAGFLGQHCPDRSILLKRFKRHHVWGLRACRHGLRFFTCKEVFGNLSNTLFPSGFFRPLHVQVKGISVLRLLMENSWTVGNFFRWPCKSTSKPMPAKSYGLAISVHQSQLWDLQICRCGFKVADCHFVTHLHPACWKNLWFRTAASMRCGGPMLPTLLSFFRKLLSKWNLWKGKLRLGDWHRPRQKFMSKHSQHFCKSLSLSEHKHTAFLWSQTWCKTVANQQEGIERLHAVADPHDTSWSDFGVREVLKSKTSAVQSCCIWNQLNSCPLHCMVAWGQASKSRDCNLCIQETTCASWCIFRAQNRWCA